MNGWKPLITAVIPTYRRSKLLRRPFLARLNSLVSVPFAITFILGSQRIHPAYRMTLRRRWLLGLRIFRNHRRIRPNGTSFKSVLAMALKLLQMPPESPGVVVECGTWKGCSAASLSLVCELTGRTLYVFDSFQGLPTPVAGDREGPQYKAGDFAGTLDEVKRNISRFGVIDRCRFVPGWFRDTLPNFKEPVALAYLDVDLEDSLEACVKNLWPRLLNGGYIFSDEACSMNYVALFFSEKWWARNFGCDPPGVIGAGCGLGLGEYYIGPWDELPDGYLQQAMFACYAKKGNTAVWRYSDVAGESNSQRSA